MNVLISGGSGMLGTAITGLLLEEGHSVAWLTRRQSPVGLPVRLFVWDPENDKIDPEAIQWAEAVINLAGASIGETHWTTKGKDLILHSRLASVRTLENAIRKRQIPLHSFVGVSGAGYYGPSEQPKLESDPHGKDFPAVVARKWEDAYEKIQSLKPAHFSVLRLAVVLSDRGGALPKIVQPIQWGVGSSLGTGRQPFNWIHLNDAARIFTEALYWNGVYNASAPSGSTNEELTRLVARILNRPLLLPAVPAFALKLALGDRSSLVLEGNRSNVSKLLKTGFTFQFPDLEGALKDLLGRNPE